VLRTVRTDLPGWREHAEAHRGALLARYSMDRRIAALQAAL